MSFYKDKLVGVTGASGLIGSYLVKALKGEGAKVRAIAHERPGNEMADMADEFVHHDLTFAELAQDAVDGCDVVMHAAGVTGGIPLGVKDPGALVAPNVLIHTNVIDACAKKKVERLGFISSTVVYPAWYGPTKEDLGFSGEPYHLYFGIGWVKRFCEKLCEFYSKSYGLKVGLVRPSGAYGRFDDFDENTSHVLPALMKRALAAKESLTVWGDGQDVRDFIHASDIARGLMLVTEKWPRCDPVNIASGTAVTTELVARMILDTIHSPARLDFDRSKPTALRERRVDIGKAEMLGFRPQVSLEDGLKDTIEWYRNWSKES